MPRFFTHYWLNRTWERNRIRASDGELLDHTAGNLFQERGIRADDIVYVVSVIKGALYICGSLVVGKICDVDEAATILGFEPEDLWEADEHIISAAATPMNFNLKVPLKVTRQLRFISDKSIKPLKFKAQNYLDEQTLRGVRELDPASAAELNALLPPLEEVSFDDEWGDFPLWMRKHSPKKLLMPKLIMRVRRNILR